MSYPIIYRANETNFSTLGLGALSDATSALVTEERNGIFYLEMKYPIDGVRFNEIKNDRLIKADAGNKLKNQRFKINHITKPSKGIVTIYASHVSQHTEELQLKPEVNYSGNALNALNIWKNNLVDAHPFSVFSDIQTQGSGKWTIEEVENARRALGGVRGSILDSYGGEYRFDNYHIGLYAQRGDDSGALIAYGKNLVELEQEEEIASTYTSIYPFSIFINDDGSEELVTLPEYFIDSEYLNNYARRKILRVDFSTEDIRTEEELRLRTQRYIEDNDVGLPKVNLKVKFIDLAKTLDYKHLKIIEEINLCDWVNVHFKKLDITQRAKVIKIVWDVLLDRYEELQIGEAGASFSKSVDMTVDGRLEEKIDPVTRRLNIIMTAANGKNKNFYGPDEPTGDLRIGDSWYKPIGDGEFELYIYNGHTWGDPVVTTGINNEVNQRLEEAKDIAETARDNTHLLQLDADSILAGLGLEGLAETNQSIVNQIKANVGDRLDDLVATKVSEDSIQYQSLIERYDLYERVIGETEEGVKDSVARIVMADNLFQTEVSDLLSETSTTVTQLSNSWALGIKSNDDLVAGINASSQGVRIFGENIVLDGDTTVDGTFTVTDTIFADNMSISKFTVGTLNAANVNLINVNVNSLVGNTSNFVQSAWNAINSNVYVDGTKLETTNTNGDYSRIESGELKSFNSSGSVSAILGRGRTQYFRDNAALMIIGHDIHDGYTNGGVVAATHNQDLAIGRYNAFTTDSNPEFIPYIRLMYDTGLDEDTGYIRISKPIRFAPHSQTDLQMNGNDIDMNNADINRVDDINFRWGGQIDVTSDNSWMRLRPVNDLYVVMQQDNSTAIRVSVNNINFHKPLFMRGGQPIVLDGHGTIIGSGSSDLDIRPSSMLRFFGRGERRMEIGNAISVHTTLYMNNNPIFDESDRRLKSNIQPTMLDSLESIKAWEFVDYTWKDGRNNDVQHGLIAQDTPEIAHLNEETDTWNINTSRQLMMTTHAVHQLSKEHDNTLLVASHAYLLAEQHEDELDCLKREVKELKDEIEELRGMCA